MYWQLILITLAAYLLGSINPAYLIAKAKGFDIRQRGSKNAGASNALILMGKKVALISALFDIFKAFLMVTLAQCFVPTLPYAGAFAGVACILGHVFPVFMRFRGGKGLACLGGFVLAYDYRIFLILFTLELILVLIVDYICVVPISASILFPLIYHIMTQDLIGTGVLGIMTFVILYKHFENIKRIQQGTEAHFSFLWKRNQEVERLQSVSDDSAAKEKEDS